jgi:hypothetical protein
LWRGLIAWLLGYVVIAVGYLAVVRIRSGEGEGLARGGLEFHPLNLDSILLGLLDYAHRLVPGGDILASAPLDVLRVLVWVEWVVLVAVAFRLWRLRLEYMLFGLAWLLFAPFAFIFFSAPTDRYFYLPSVGFAIFFGCLLGGLPLLLPQQRRDRQVGVMVAACLSLFVLLALRGADLASRVATWRAAGHIAGGVVKDIRTAVPEPRDYGTFFFVGVPVFLNGVPIFQNGLQEAVQRTYGNTTVAAQTTDCLVLRTATELPRYSYFFQYKPNGVTQFATVGECRLSQ